MTRVQISVGAFNQKKSIIHPITLIKIILLKYNLSKTKKESHKKLKRPFPVIKTAKAIVQGLIPKPRRIKIPATISNKPIIEQTTSPMNLLRNRTL